jgi:hypothetical protein
MPPGEHGEKFCWAHFGGSHLPDATFGTTNLAELGRSRRKKCVLQSAPRAFNLLCPLVPLTMGVDRATWSFAVFP